MGKTADVVSIFTQEKCLTVGDAIEDSKAADLKSIVVVGWKKDGSLFIRSGSEKVLTREEAFYLMEMGKMNSLGQLD